VPDCLMLPAAIKRPAEVYWSFLALEL